MPKNNLIRFNVGGRDPLTLFQLKQGTNFTVPSSKQVASAVGSDVGGANLASVVPTVGGQMLCAMNDGAAGTATIFDLTNTNITDLNPGDVIAVSAVASNAVTVTVTSVDGTVRSYTFNGITTVAHICGFYA